MQRVAVRHHWRCKLSLKKKKKKKQQQEEEEEEETSVCVYSGQTPAEVQNTVRT